MAARFKTLDDLPAFASEDDLAAALMGKGRTGEFRQMVPLLEARGFPKVDGLMGGRYVPAVRAFFDREYRVRGDQQIAAPHGPAMLGAYSGRRKAGAGT
jgi:hypothetical protein